MRLSDKIAGAGSDNTVVRRVLTQQILQILSQFVAFVHFAQISLSNSNNVITGSPNSGSLLDFGFIRECLRTNKIRPKCHFWTNREIKMTYIAFVFCY